MTEPDPLTNLTFNEAAPIPNHTASGADETPPLTPPPNPGAESPTVGARRRLLPGKMGNPGSRDGNRKDERQRAAGVKTDRKPLPPIPANMAQGIEELYGALAVAVMPFDVELASALMEIAPKAAEAWVELARKNHAVRRILLKMLETSAWGALIAAHMPLFRLAMARTTGQSTRSSMVGEFLAAEVHPPAEPPA